MTHIAKVDFGKVIGKIKPMNSTNIGPRQGGFSLSADFTNEFREMGIPFVRLHDVEYPYGQNQFVDIHCIFPNFDADETLPESYNFNHTDMYLKGIIDAGGQVFYRLGESIDHFTPQLFVHPPKDYGKWARICEHIIRHYNEGWANGFHYDIKYWEIWNEPDNRKMWTGTHGEFFKLYEVTSKHLKACFGDSIKVGGCAFSGFYVNNRENCSEWFQSLVPYMHEFLTYITAEETKSPMDFFSWHCYALTPEEVALHAAYAEEMIKQYRLENCESILNEFNMFYCFSEYTPYHKGCFADIAASMVVSQKSSMDMLMHYASNTRGRYNIAFNLDFDGKTVIRFAGFESMRDFGSLYRLGTEVYTEGDEAGKINLLAAKNGEAGGIMLVARDYSGDIEIELDGTSYTNCKIKHTTDDSPRGEAVVWYDNVAVENGKITVMTCGNELMYIELK